MDENPLKYKKSHKADYEEENVEVKENRDILVLFVWKYYKIII